MSSTKKIGSNALNGGDEGDTVNRTDSNPNVKPDNAEETNSQELAVEPGVLGFFAAAADDKAISLKVVNPTNVEMSPDEIITAPDGGWGWLIVFVAFLSNVLVDGTIYSFSFVQKDITDKLRRQGDGHESEIAGTAWVGSLILGFNLLSGPLTSVLADRFGFRAVSMTGSFITGFAFVISAVTADLKTALPNLPVMLTFYGVIGGIGSGMIYMPSVVCVGYYFDKKRALAVGLAISGTGCGAFIFAPITKLIIEASDWRAAVLMQACLLFSCCMLGSLYRPLEADYAGDEDFHDLNKMTKRMRVAMSNLAERDAAEELEENERENEDKNKEQTKKAEGGDDEGIATSRFMSLIETAVGGTGIQFEEGVVVKVPSSTTINKPKIRPESYLVGAAKDKKDAKTYIYAKAEKSGIIKGGNIGSDGDGSSSLRRRLTSTVFFSDESIPLSLQGWDFEDEVKPEEPKLPLGQRCIRGLKNIRIIAMPSFWVLAIAGLLMTLGYPVPFMYLTEMALKEGVEEEIAMSLLSFMGSANTVGRILCGYFSDSDKVNTMLLNNVAIMLGGGVTAALPFLIKLPGASLTVFFSFTILFGSAMATFATLRSILIRDYIGLSNLTSAFGLCLAFQGIAAVTSSPLADAMFKSTGNYLMSFLVAGTLMIASGAISFLLPLTNKIQQRLDANSETDPKRSV